jgi:hypothetical protein
MSGHALAKHVMSNLPLAWRHCMSGHTLAKQSSRAASQTWRHTMASGILCMHSKLEGFIRTIMSMPSSQAIPLPDVSRHRIMASSNRKGRIHHSPVTTNLQACQSSGTFANPTRHGIAYKTACGDPEMNFVCTIQAGQSHTCVLPRLTCWA